MSERLPNEQEFLGWLQDPVTQLVLRRLPAAKIAGLKDTWARGSYTYPTSEATYMKNAEALGELAAWTWLNEMAYADLLTELGEESDGTTDEATE